MPRDSKHKHVIKLVCVTCREEYDYKLNFPTAVFCDHCGSLQDARLSIIKNHK